MDGKSISDKLREFVGIHEHELDATSEFSLLGLADRIDAEMVELPRGKDGKPIRVGETVYGEDGRAWHVEGVSLGRWSMCAEGHVVHVTGDFGPWRDFKPEWLTHERPDSFERIAREFDEWRLERMRDLGEGDFDDLGLFAERIRKLAERDER